MQLARAHMRDTTSPPSISCGLVLAHRSLAWPHAFQSLKGTDSCSRYRRQRPQAAFSTTFTDASGKVSRCRQETISVGTDKAAALVVTGANAAPQHAEIQRLQSRTTCTALLGDPDDLFADTYTWLDGNQLRTGVAYLIKSGCTLAFGELSQAFTVEFEEQLANTQALEMMIKEMASQASEDVRKELGL